MLFAVLLPRRFHMQWARLGPSTVQVVRHDLGHAVTIVQGVWSHLVYLGWMAKPCAMSHVRFVLPSLRTHT